jgi:hypothetical protein
MKAVYKQTSITWLNSKSLLEILGIEQNNNYPVIYVRGHQLSAKSQKVNTSGCENYMVPDATALLCRCRTKSDLDNM